MRSQHPASTLSANFAAKTTSSNTGNNRSNKCITQRVSHRSNGKQGSLPICQYCDTPGHVIKQCHKLQAAFPWLNLFSSNSAASSQGASIPQPNANMVAVGTNGNQNWLIDSEASLHVTNDLQNLSLHSDYTGDDLMLGDGKILMCQHTLVPPSFLLLIVICTCLCVLCVPSTKENFTSVYHLCDVFVEFSPFSYVVMDYRTGVPLVRGKPKNGLYEWPKNLSTSSKQTINPAFHSQVLVYFSMA